MASDASNNSPLGQIAGAASCGWRASAQTSTPRSGAAGVRLEERYSVLSACPRLENLSILTSCSSDSGSNSAPVDANVSRERGHIESIARRRVDGVMLAPVEHSTLNSSLLQRGRIPQVLIHRRLPLANADVLLSDSYARGCLLTRHLLEQGFERIGFIGGRADVHLGRYDLSSGDEIVTRLLAEGALPEALMAATNYVAVGVVQALRRHGLDAPRDVALA